MTNKTSESELTSQITARAERLEKELAEYRRRHQRAGCIDSRMHQALIIFSVVASVVSASAASYIDEAWIIGLIGAVPGMAALLSQQLHCVEAANLHFRRVHVADALLARLHYEVPIHAGEKNIAELAQEFRSIEEKLTFAWEEVTKSGAARLVSPKNRPSTRASNAAS